MLNHSQMTDFIHLFNSLIVSEAFKIAIGKDASLDPPDFEAIGDYFNGLALVESNDFKALVEFPVGGEDGDRALFYLHASDSSRKELIVYVKYGQDVGQATFASSTTPSSDSFPNGAAPNLGFRSISGYAVDSEGRVQIYCMALFGNDLFLLVFPMETKSKVEMQNQISNNEFTLEIKDIRNLGGFNKEKLTNVDGKAGVTFPLEEKHLSLVIHSDGNNNYVFNANTKTMERDNTITLDRDWGGDVLYATRASEIDKISLGCDGTGGGGGGDTGGGKNNDVCTYNKHAATQHCQLRTLMHYAVFPYTLNRLPTCCPGGLPVAILHS